MLCFQYAKLIMQSGGRQLQMPEHSREETEKASAASNEGFITEESGFCGVSVCVFMCVL